MGVPLNFLIQQWTFCLVQSQLSVTCFDFSTWHLGTLHIVLLPHTIFHTPLCHTQSFTHNFHTHDLSHKTLSHTPFSLSHTIFHIPLCHAQLFTYNLFYFSILHHILCLSFLPPPLYNICCSLLEEVDLWVIRSFNFHNIWDNPSHWLIFFRGVGQPPTRQHILNFPSSICSKQLQYFWILTIQFPQFHLVPITIF